MKYITTAIAYLNGAPHVGHALDFLLADVLNRYQKSRGETTFLQTGTDEHGQKVASKAKALGISPQELCDENSALFRALWQDLDAKYDYFIRTTNPNHIKNCQEIWLKLAENGLIYKKPYHGWYCEGCESFITETEAREKNFTCPIHNQPLQEISEDNYFLKVTALIPQIKAAIERGRALSTLDALNGETTARSVGTADPSDDQYLKILPDFRASEILNLLEKSEDVSISRPKSQVSWGIPVPNDPDQTMYVWIDALSNYLTTGHWPASTQIIGKDILRFHAITWPAILLGLGLPLPRLLLTHGFVNVDGTKMSKSLGNVISPTEVIARYGTDAFRFYFLKYIPTCDDGDFTWAKYDAAYNDLANTLGNLVSRLANMNNKYFAGLIGTQNEQSIDKSDDSLPNIVKSLAKYHHFMQNLDFSDALTELFNHFRDINAEIDAAKPWTLAKSDDTLPELRNLLENWSSRVATLASALAPFLPTTSQKILAIFQPEKTVYNGEILFPKPETTTP
ncbi:MAG: methionine--tRNA ligase [Candidatus Nomurabacteria bacterium]|jgi:methionyl-tRNA synthetase|nr:methionine--tRNA ligase [Candidatus Nomurabacteria bacterium]